MLLSAAGPTAEPKDDEEAKHIAPRVRAGTHHAQDRSDPSTRQGFLAKRRSINDTSEGFKKYLNG